MLKVILLYSHPNDQPFMVNLFSKLRKDYPKVVRIFEPRRKQYNAPKFENNHLNTLYYTRFLNDEIIRSLIHEIYYPTPQTPPQGPTQNHNYQSLNSNQTSNQTSNQNRRQTLELNQQLIIIHNLPCDSAGMYIFLKSIGEHYHQRPNFQVNHCIVLGGGGGFYLKDWFPFIKNIIVIPLKQRSVDGTIGAIQKIINTKYKKIKRPIPLKWICSNIIKYIPYNTDEWNMAMNHLIQFKQVSPIQPLNQSLNQYRRTNHKIISSSIGKKTLLFGVLNKGLYGWNWEQLCLFKVKDISKKVYNYIFNAQLILMGILNYFPSTTSISTQQQQQQKDIFTFYINGFTGLYHQGSLFEFLMGVRQSWHSCQTDENGQLIEVDDTENDYYRKKYFTLQKTKCGFHLFFPEYFTDRDPKDHEILSNIKFPIQEEIKGNGYHYNMILTHVNII